MILDLLLAGLSSSGEGRLPVIWIGAGTAWREGKDWREGVVAPDRMFDEVGEAREEDGGPGKVA
jgi:hypothetical protein